MVHFTHTLTTLSVCLSIRVYIDGESLQVSSEHNDFKRQVTGIYTESLTERMSTSHFFKFAYTEPGVPRSLMLLEATKESLFIQWRSPAINGGSPWPIISYRVQTINQRNDEILNRLVNFSPIQSPTISLIFAPSLTTPLIWLQSMMKVVEMQSLSWMLKHSH